MRIRKLGDSRFCEWGKLAVWQGLGIDKSEDPALSC